MMCIYVLYICSKICINDIQLVVLSCLQLVQELTYLVNRNGISWGAVLPNTSTSTAQDLELGILGSFGKRPSCFAHFSKSRAVPSTLRQPQGCGTDVQIDITPLSPNRNPTPPETFGIPWGCSLDLWLLLLLVTISPPPNPSTPLPKPG